MKLSQDIIKPSVRSVLSFTHEELVTALFSYAKQCGYSLDYSAQFTVWYPNLYDSERLTQLVGNVKGTNPAISKGAKECI